MILTSLLPEPAETRLQAQGPAPIELSPRESLAERSEMIVYHQVEHAMTTPFHLDERHLILLVVVREDHSLWSAQVLLTDTAPLSRVLPRNHRVLWSRLEIRMTGHTIFSQHHPPRRIVANTTAIIALIIKIYLGICLYLGGKIDWKEVATEVLVTEAAGLDIA